MNFISGDNQELLWQLLQKTPTFGLLNQSNKETLFKNNIEKYYSSLNPEHTLTYENLQKINKSMLSNILKTIPKNNTVQFSTDITYSDHTGMVIADPRQQGSYFVETSEEQTNREFEERQHAYNLMNAKPELQDSHSMFEESAGNDTIITNMDELLKEYQNQRTLDLSFGEPPYQEKKTVPNEETSSESYISMLEEKINDLIDRVANIESNLGI
jgi:hypothetical protein